VKVKYEICRVHDIQIRIMNTKTFHNIQACLKRFELLLVQEQLLKSPERGLTNRKDTFILLANCCKNEIKVPQCGTNCKISMVNSVFRALDILKSLGDGLETLSDIVSSLNLKKTTTHRLLKALETSGFVIQDPVTKHYYIGPAAINLASSPDIAHKKLIIYALDEMKYLQALSGESVALWVKVGMQRTILEELPSTHNIRYTLGKGFFAPMQYGTGGKIILSELSESERQMVINGTKLVTRTNEVIDKETLLSELKKIKQQGYVITIDETIEGAGGISVPIKNYICPAALSVFGPKERFRKDVIMSLVKEIKESAERISRKLLD